MVQASALEITPTLSGSQALYQINQDILPGKPQFVIQPKTHRPTQIPSCIPSSPTNSPSDSSADSPASEPTCCQSEIILTHFPRENQEINLHWFLEILLLFHPLEPPQIIPGNSTCKEPSESPSIPPFKVQALSQGMHLYGWLWSFLPRQLEITSDVSEDLKSLLISATVQGWTWNHQQSKRWFKLQTYPHALCSPSDGPTDTPRFFPSFSPSCHLNHLNL